MIIELLMFALSTLVAYLYCSYWKKVTAFTTKGVKVVPGVPLFGNFWRSSFLRRHLVEDINHCYNAFPEERYIGIHERTTSVIFIRDPEIIKQVTVRHFDHFVDRGSFLGQDADAVLANNLSALKGEKWRQMRATLSPAYTAAKIKQMFRFMDGASLNVIDYLRRKIDENGGSISEDTDVDDLMRRYASDVIASAVFGLELNSVEDKNNKFYEIGSLGSGRRADDEVGFATAEKDDWKIDNDVKQWTDDELTAQAFVFFLAGFETSSAVLVMAVHELALNPCVQHKLHEELKIINDANASLSFDIVKDMNYLDMVVNETLRKWSPALFLNRICTKTYQLPPPRPGAEPYTVEPGQIVYSAASSIQTDGKYYPHPDRFDPERFSEKNKKDIQQFTFMPFGLGPRNCIGSRFALLELKVLLCRLVLSFEILKCCKTTDPLRLQPTDFQIKALGGTWIKLRRRH